MDVNKIIPYIDNLTANVVRATSWVGSSYAGLIANSLRSDVSIRGMSGFDRASVSIPEAVYRIVTDHFAEAAKGLSIKPDSGAAETLQIAAQQIRGYAESARLTSARMLRAQVSARLSASPASQRNTHRFVTRSGHAIRLSDGIAMTFRKAILDAYNESAVESLTAQGKTSARVEHVDVNHPVHNMQIAIGSSPSELPNYVDIQEKVFHPRANAIVTEI